MACSRVLSSNEYAVRFIQKYKLYQNYSIGWLLIPCKNLWNRTPEMSNCWISVLLQILRYCSAFIAPCYSGIHCTTWSRCPNCMQNLSSGPWRPFVQIRSKKCRNHSKCLSGTDSENTNVHLQSLFHHPTQLQDCFLSFMSSLWHARLVPLVSFSETSRRPFATDLYIPLTPPCRLVFTFVWPAIKLFYDSPSSFIWGLVQMGPSLLFYWSTVRFITPFWLEL